MAIGCEARRDQILDLAYGELDDARASELQAHLEGCADCRAELSRLEETRRAYSPLLVARANQLPGASSDLPLLAAARAKLAARAAPENSDRDAQVIPLAGRAPDRAAPVRTARSSRWKFAAGAAIAASLALIITATNGRSRMSPAQQRAPVPLASAPAKPLPAPLASPPADALAGKERAQELDRAAPLETLARAAIADGRWAEALDHCLDAARLREKIGGAENMQNAARDLAGAIQLELKLGQRDRALALRAELAGLSPSQTAELSSADAVLEQKQEIPARRAAKPRTASDSPEPTSVDF